MASSFTTFPCCACRHGETSIKFVFDENICKFRELQFKRLLKHVLEKLIHHIDPNTRDIWFNNDDEKHVLKILFHDKDPNTGEICLNSKDNKHAFEKLIHHFDPDTKDCCSYNEHVHAPFFTEREYNMGRSIAALLRDCYEKDSSPLNVNNVTALKHVCPVLKWHLNRIVRNNETENPFDVLSGKASYQRLVVDCLFFTAKFMTQCMNKLPSEKMKIFNDVAGTVEEFFIQSNILGWIEHSIQLMDPFGIVSGNEYVDDSDFCSDIF